LALVELNRRINHQIVYTSDDKQYGKSEWWAVNPKSNKGDCEDYALTKISELANANLPNVTFYTVRLAVVRVTEDNAKPVRGEVFHAVATWRDSNGNQWVLDNCCDVPFTRKQLERGIMGIKYVWLW
jgi:predicted transglutaminase-like cysteine proteinase